MFFKSYLQCKTIKLATVSFARYAAPAEAIFSKKKIFFFQKNEFFKKKKKKKFFFSKKMNPFDASANRDLARNYDLPPSLLTPGRVADSPQRVTWHTASRFQNLRLNFSCTVSSLRSSKNLMKKIKKSH